jgi:hypothetical protein
MYENLALLAAFVLVYSSVAGAIERTWISGPIVFTCFGLLTHRSHGSRPAHHGDRP